MNLVVTAKNGFTVDQLVGDLKSVGFEVEWQGKHVRMATGTYDGNIDDIKSLPSVRHVGKELWYKAT